jgi:RNA polymerase sigma-70 factor (ECF subfamily)
MAAAPAPGSDALSTPDSPLVGRVVRPGRAALASGPVADLVERARDGDDEAWVQLYRNAFPGLYAFARRRLFTHEDALDAVNETMARAVASLSSFRQHDGAFAGWLFGILRNVVMNAQRAAGRPAAAVADMPMPEPIEPLVADEDAMELRAAFAQLPPADRELLELRVVAGLSAEEVASVLDRTPGAVRTAQSRALARLRQLLEVTR